MRRFLVTGGAGFIGSHFIKFLLKKDSEASVINLDKLTYAGNLSNLKEIENNPRYTFAHGDVCDVRLVRSLINRVDWVVHFASETHVDRSIDSGEDFIRTNVLGTQVLLQAMLETQRIERFIHFSTDEVYGSTTQGKFKEETPLCPTSPYAASKAGADLLAQAYIKTHRLPIIILRGCNNFGPNQYPEKAIPLFITNILEGKKIPLYSKGENSREWIFVEETSRAILFACEHGRKGEVYNVGSGFELKNIDLIKMILKIMKKTENEITYVKDRLAHDLRYYLDSNKINSLGFRVTSNFEDNLKSTINWYKENESWWKALKHDRYTVK